MDSPGAGLRQGIGTNTLLSGNSTRHVLITAFGASPIQVATKLTSARFPVSRGSPPRTPCSRSKALGQGCQVTLAAPPPAEMRAAQPSGSWAEGPGVLWEPNVQTLTGRRWEVGKSDVLFIKLMFVAFLESKIVSKRFPLTSALASLLSHCH